MGLFKNVSLFFLCFIFFLDVSGQKKKIPFNVNTLFGDLPVNDPSANSVLKEGEDPYNKISKNILAKAQLNKSSCFVGEPLLLTVKLMTLLQSDSKITGRPSLDGFTVTAMKFSNEKPEYTTIGGKVWRVFVIEKLQVTPLVQGTVMIDSLSVSNQVSYQKPDRTKATYSGIVKSAALKLLVSPLLAAGRPPDFSGAVGNFDLQASAASLKAETGQDNLLHIEINGNGDLTAFEPPSIQWPEGVDTFSLREKMIVSDTSFPIIGKKIFEIPFVVKKEGTFTIPAFHINFFDPVLKIYKTVFSKSISIDITASAQKPEKPVYVAGKQPVNHNFFVYLFFACILLVAGGIYYYMARKRKQERIRLEKELQEQELEQLRIAASKKIFDAEAAFGDVKAADSDQVFLEKYKWYLSKCYKIAQNDMSEFDSAVLTESIPEDDAMYNEAKQLFDACNAHLYMPGFLQESDRNTMLADFRNLVKRMVPH